MRAPRHLIVMGTFRTGSTFMAKALSAHPRLTVASDPYFQFFKAYRNEVMLRAGAPLFDPDSPVADNFYSAYAPLHAKLRRATLRVPIARVPLRHTLARIAQLAKRDSPKLVGLLPQVRAKTYEELFRRLMGLIRQAYGRPTDAYVGFKCTFTEQFLEVLFNTDPAMKCIYLVRDPRAVAASQGVFYERPEHRRAFRGRGQYPLLYVIRHWRKSIAYLLDNLERREQVLLVRYEDVITRPEAAFRRICAFLGVGYDPQMTDARRYQDGEGRPWTQNSSYGTSRAITARFARRWRQVLSRAELQLIEDLCSPEMERLGYPRLTSDRLLESCLHPPVEPVERIDPWIRSYLGDFILDERQAERELLRRELMDHAAEGRGSSEWFERLYIGEDYVNRLARLKVAAHA